jgi:hypothetical protein
MPEILCLHSLKDKAVIEASVPVMKDIQVSRLGGVSSENTYYQRIVYNHLILRRVQSSGRPLKMQRS